MCGIVGIYAQNEKTVEELSRSVTMMAACLAHRGPDDQGFYIGKKIALGHRRLSIIDLQTGHQPIFNEDRSICIIFNGEIYNYQEIKSELLGKGHRFASESDTETIIHAYEEWGEASVHRLRGMFSFCIWDERKDTLLLVRDRLGEKPLFYAQYDGNFVFASEMKAILADPRVDRTMDWEALGAYFTFSYIPAPLTIFKSIKKLSPGHLLTCSKGKVRVRQYWDVSFAPDRRKTEGRFIQEYLELLNESVRLQLRSDVPLGAFLSGGVDSSTVVALMSRTNGSAVNTFTIGFGGNIGGFDDERKYARLVAERYHTHHREHEVHPDVGGLIGKIVRAFDEPFADDSTVPSYFVSELARRNVTVALSGLGGDELFCGYERYLGFQMTQIYQRIPGMIRDKVIRRLIEELPELASGNYTVSHLKRFVRSSFPECGRRYFGFVSKINPKYKDTLFQGRAQDHSAVFNAVEQGYLDLFNAAPAEDPLNKVFYCDMKTYLPEDILACTDRLSMHHSLEVRVPFLDYKLVEYCATIPPEMKIKWLKKKYLLKKGVAGLLPKAVLDHKKQGFVGPMTRWLQTDLKELTREMLSERNLGKHDLFDGKTVDRILDDHYSGREINDTTIWSLMMFQSWFNQYQV
jgi:asparagine synthase (glutamine-hydrolysing)